MATPLTEEPAGEFPTRLERPDAAKRFHEHWHKLDGTQLGVNVVDPDGHDIGNAVASYKPWQKWTPVDGRKHVLVGRVDNYGFYNPDEPWNNTPEADFNIFIDPSADFRFILDDVLGVMSQDEKDKQPTLVNGNGYPVECEITPDEEYYDNPWFPGTDDPTSPLVGREIGLYGPWVRDSGHGGKPEIHPSEVIWWRDRSVADIATGAEASWRCLVLQDDSNRFDRDEDYEGTPLRPWSKSPRRERITFALAAFRDQHVGYDITIEDGLRVFAWPGEDSRSLFQVAPSGRAASGGTSVQVRKLMPNRNQVKARLSRLLADPGDPTVYHCFLTLDIRVGDGDRGDEGFAQLLVRGHQRQSRDVVVEGNG